MDHTTPQQVRRIVVETFRDLGVAPPCLFQVEEEILVHAGRYMARSYRADGLMAMWLLDVGLVQFYDEEGNMLRTVNLFEDAEPKRMAA